jgi:hypothetical protein
MHLLAARTIALADFNAQEYDHFCKASHAKAGAGDKSVFDHIASLPQPQRGIA